MPAKLKICGFAPRWLLREFEQSRSLTKYQVYRITPTVIYSLLQCKRFLKAIKNCSAIFQRNKNPHQVTLDIGKKTPLSDVTVISRYSHLHKFHLLNSDWIQLLITLLITLAARRAFKDVFSEIWHLIFLTKCVSNHADHTWTFLLFLRELKGVAVKRTFLLQNAECNPDCNSIFFSTPPTPLEIVIWFCFWKNE